MEMMRMIRDENSNEKPSEEKKKGKLEQIWDILTGGWSPRKFYNDKIAEPIKSRLPNWSPKNFFNEKIKKPILDDIHE